MKKSLIILSVICFIFNTAISQVTQVHRALLMKKTATWCNPCGTWGWDLQEQIKTDNDAKAVILQVHSSATSGLNSSVATELQDNFPSCSYTPAWYVNGVNNTVTSPSGGIYTSLTRTAVKNSVDSTYNVTPLANCAYTKTINGYNLTVNTTTKFFIDTTGEYYLSVLIMEDDVVAYQNGIGNAAHHMNLLRGSMSSSAFGEQIATGTIAANSTFTKTFVKTLNTSWNLKNVTLAFIIWKKVGITYQYVNAFKTGQSVNINESYLNKPEAFNIFPTLAFNHITIENNCFNDKEAILSIYNVNGQLVLQQLTNQEKTELDISRLVKGVYVLRISNNKYSEVTKIVKE